MHTSVRNLSLLLLFGAHALLTWRVYAFSSFPLWVLGILFSAFLSFSIILFLAQEEKRERELAKRQKEALHSQIETLRISQIKHSEENIQERELKKMQILSLEKALQEKMKEIDLEKARSLSFQGALEEMHEELKRFQERAHHESEALQALHILKHQHLQLRQQFDEKNEKLKEARQQLFDLEGRYLILLRESADKILECEQEAANSIEISALGKSELSELEIQIQELEEIISHLSAPKKRAPRKKKNPIDKMLEFHF